ncbi:MAG: efflux RND transporter periplasmic adaptor subunit [Hoeflea sp.]|uniref:efflux RND transporter periplasmic adaptor subunit n=1 Tax=Hoeflea sp. TaxID=1940281 RepID=UPI00273169B9|nr:efflux RND transporter periplasmic adaptor subunit [Hoeflea sp.]MDP2120087.1 efflux RND transporter periplasmic adaptor subunit [Hoeflea sp.]
MRKIPRWAFSLGSILVLGLIGWNLGAARLLDDLNLPSLLSSSEPGFAETEARKQSRVQSSANFRLAEAELRRIIQSVDATGSVTPVALFAVGSQVSGQIKEVYADFNSEVTRGQPLALIDPLSFQINVDQAEATVGVARAGVDKAEVLLRDAEADLERKTALASNGSGTKAEAAKALANRDLAQTQRDDAFFSLKGAEAALRQARTDLERTVIRSPDDGTVIVKAVEVGTNVAVSLQAPILFTIAKDLQQMQINMAIPEAEIGRIRVGQQVDFTVDSYPGRPFQGAITQIRKQPQSTQNVVSYTVIATAPNPELLLLPGMTATAKIIIAAPDPRLAVPTAALRFRPQGVARSPGARLFVERDGEAMAIAVIAGASDESFTAIEAEGINPGDLVITGLAGNGSDGPAESGGSVLSIFK